MTSLRTYTRTARRLALTDRCYRLLLLIYPARFRRAYGYEMAQTFRASCRETFSAEGGLGLLRLCGSTLFDLLTTSLKEHLQTLLALLKQLSGSLSPSGLDALALTAPLRLQVAQQTDIGCKRTTNEDNLLTVLPENPQILQNKGALFIVADGMGGHTRGDRASELAVNTVREVYYRDERESRADALIHAMQEANALIYKENIANTGVFDAKTSMGTTCISAVLQGHTLIIANVGDSRAYVVHEGQIRQISQDHSLVANLLREGIITPEQARNHEQRNVIYRSLGTQAEVEVDVFVERVAEGDMLILCTDGLSGLVEDDEMRRIVEFSPPEESARQLIARANAAGGPDNITAIVVRVSD